MIPLFLEMFAFVFFVVAVVWNPEPYRDRLVAMGLACWVLAVILAGHPL